MAFLQDKADQEKKTLYETLQEYLNHHLFQETRAKEFVGLIEKYRVPKEEKVSDILQGLLKESGYERLLQNDGDQERLDNLAELKRSVIIYEKEAKEKVSLQEYLEQVALYTNLDLVSKRDTVKLMTLHASKGLEFPYVFIIGLTDGVVPNYRSLEEERRLLYVGLQGLKELSISAIQRYKAMVGLMFHLGFYRKLLMKRLSVLAKNLQKLKIMPQIVVQVIALGEIVTK